MSLNALVSVAGGTVEVAAANGNVVTAVVQTVGGNVRLTASGGVSVGLVDARNGANQNNWGDVSVTALGGNITDAGADALVNIYGRSVRLSATGNAGTLVPATADALEVTAQTLAVNAGGSVNVVALNSALAVGVVTALSANRVGVTGGLTASPDGGSLAGVTGVTGVVVRTLSGALTVNAAVSNTGAGNVLLSATGGDVTLAGNVTAGNGSLSVLASGSLGVNAGMILSVTGGTADIAALGGSVTLSGTVQTVGTNIRIAATVNVSLGLVDARTAADRTNGTLTGQGSWGDVSVVATGGSITEAGSDALPDVYARNLRMVSGVAIGVTGGNALETEAVTLAMATGTGGINVIDAGNVTVGTVGVVSASRVQVNGDVLPVADGASLTGVVKAGGSLVLDTANGSNIPGFPTFAVNSVLTTGSTANPLTGLYEQKLQITNTTGSTIDAVRVAVGNLPAGVTVVNAAGTVIDGRAYVMFNQSLLPGQTAELVVEYRVGSGGSVPLAATFEVDVVGVQAAPNLAGATQLSSGVQVQRLGANGDYLIQFGTLAGRTYYMQYSDDGLNWITMLPPITGTGTTVSRLDQGPPYSFPEPATVSQRNYRIFLMP